MPKKSKEYHKKFEKLFSFKSKGVSIIMFIGLFVVAYSTQAYLDARFNPDVVSAKEPSKSKAQEAYEINTEYSVLETDLENFHYMNPGELDITVYGFGIQTFDETLSFKGITLTKHGTTPDQMIVSAKLYEGENEIAKGTVRDGILTFNKFTSIIQPNTTKEYIIKADLSGEAKSGSRFRFQIENPHALNLSIDGSQVYSLDRYPIKGAYVSVLGFRK